MQRWSPAVTAGVSPTQFLRGPGKPRRVRTIGIAAPPRIGRRRRERRGGSTARPTRPSPTPPRHAGASAAPPRFAREVRRHPRAPASARPRVFRAGPLPHTSPPEAVQNAAPAGARASGTIARTRRTTHTRHRRTASDPGARIRNRRRTRLPRRSRRRQAAEGSRGGVRCIQRSA